MLGRKAGFEGLPTDFSARLALSRQPSQPVRPFAAPFQSDRAVPLAFEQRRGLRTPGKPLTVPLAFKANRRARQLQPATKHPLPAHTTLLDLM